MRLLTGGFLALLARHRNTLVKAAGVLGGLCAASLLLLPLQNPDFFWHLSAGKYIAQNHAVPSADFLSWARQGTAWIDFEWLFQLAVYGLYTCCGDWGVFLFRNLFFIALLFVLWRHLKLYGRQNYAFVVLPLMMAALRVPDIRPDNLTVLFFALCFYWLEKYRLDSFSRDVKILCPAAFFLFMVWANYHGGFVLGLFLLGVYAADGLLREWRNPPPQRDLSRAAGLFYISAAAFAGTLINPYGPKLYAVILRHNAEAAMLAAYIDEWQPSSVMFYPQRPYFVILTLTLAAVAARAIKLGRVQPAHVVCAVYLAVMSARYSRHTDFMVLLGLPLLALYAGELAEQANWRRFVRVGAAALTAATLFFLIVLWRGPLGAPPWGLVLGARGSCRFLRANTAEMAPLRMYNEWLYGGYMGYALYPDFRIFLDGRYLFHDYLQVLSETYANPPKWNRFLDENKIDLAVFKLRHTDAVIMGKNGFSLQPDYRLMFPPERWAIIYWDSECAVFVRRVSVPPRWLREHEFSLLVPDGFKPLAIEIFAGRMKPETLRPEVERYLRLTTSLDTPDPVIAAGIADWYNGISAVVSGGVRQP